VKTLVVGAGPAGLSAALAMAQRGIHAKVVELKADRATVGSELCLMSANLRTLDSLGVADACVAAGIPITAPGRFMKANGELIAEITPPKLTREDLPASVGIQRRALHDVLYDACRAHGVEIEHGTSIVDIRHTDGSVQAVFADGRGEDFDLIVGADGVNSAVRRIAFPDASKPEFVGQVVWRVRVPYEGPPRLDLFAAPHAGAGFITVSKDTAYLFCLLKGDEARRVKEDEFVAEAKAAFGQFGGTIAESLDSITDASQVNYSALRPNLVTPTWYRDGVLLIGDAAHAVTPHLAHGAGLAIEDGLVLGEELERHANVEAAAAAFMKRRFDRCAFAVETTVKLSRLQQDSAFPTPEQSQITHAGLQRLAEPI